jgi:hypothetical protein
LKDWDSERYNMHVTNKDAAYHRKRGHLDVYIELFRTGIRDICLPNFGEKTPTRLDYIVKECRKHGFSTMLVVHDRIAADGRPFKSYQRIIFRRGKKKAANVLRQTLQRSGKRKCDHEVMGRILGYSNSAIKEFTKGHRKAVHRRDRS